MRNGALTFFDLVELLPRMRVIQGVIVKDNHGIVKDDHGEEREQWNNSIAKKSTIPCLSPA